MRDQIASIYWIIEKTRIPEKKFPTTSFTALKYLTLWITTNWKILQEVGIPDHLICHLRNLYGSQESIVRTGHGTMTGSKLGQEYIKVVSCHPAYLTSMQSTSCRMPGLMKYKMESR